MTEQLQTRWATLTWISANEIEVRFASGILLDRAAIAEVIGARKRMQGNKPIGLLLIVPMDTELDVAIISTNHLTVNQATDHILGFAVVASSAVSEVLLCLYKAYYPTPFQAEVFTDETAAQVWLRECIAPALKTFES